MQKLRPSLMFVGEHHGKAEEAMHFYASLFADSAVGDIYRYPDDGSEMGGTVMRADLRLAGQSLQVMDSGTQHPFTFTPAISFTIDFDDAAELDRVHAGFMEAGGFELMPLQEYPFSPRFAWVGDRYGVTWQLVLVG